MGSLCPLAHLLRNSLNVVIGRCDLLAEKAAPEEIRKHAKAVSGAAWSMAEILKRCQPERCEKQAEIVECQALDSTLP